MVVPPRTELQPSSIPPVSSTTLPPVTERERYLAGGMHLASIPFPILAPAITFLLSGKSRFVKSHSFQAIFETLILKAAVFLVGAISLTFTLITLWNHYQNNDWENISWTTVIVKFIVGWILFAILEIFNTIVSVRQAYLAFKCQWPKREVRKAQKLST